MRNRSKINEKMEYHPPQKIAEQILKRIYPDKGFYTALGDFGEVYNTIRQESGLLRANLWYWLQIIKSVPSVIRNLLYWRKAMFKNYIKIALRNIKKYKVYSLINISGLTIGITCSLLISFWIVDELSYDSFHRDVERIYQVVAHGAISNNPSLPIPFAPIFKEAFPEIVHASRYESFDEALVSREDIAFYESGIKVVDPDFLNIFSFDFLYGDPDKALADIHSVVISEAIAKKYFADDDPIGKTLTLNRELNLTVSGVMKNVPRNSSLRFDIIIPYDIKLRQLPERGVDPTSWGTWSPNTFIKLHENNAIGPLNGKIADFLQRQIEGEDAVISLLPMSQRKIFFQQTGRTIAIYSTIAIFILVLACINFMNLSTAKSATRMCEIGIRKVTGATRKNLVFQFLGESFVLVSIALVLAVAITLFILPMFNTVTGKQLSLDGVVNWTLVAIIFGLMFLTGLTAGSYPAIFLSSFQPVRILKGELRGGSNGILFRKILVVLQFTISIFLVIGSGVIYKQLTFMKTADIGYIKEHLINITLEGDSRNFFPVLKNRWMSDDRIVGVSGMADDLPYFGWGTSTAQWEGKNPDKEILVNLNMVDYDFASTLGIPMAEGRFFSRDFRADAENSIVVNEKMVEIMGLSSGLGAQITWAEKTRTIVGVIMNFHFQPMTREITPIFFVMNPEKTHLYNIAIRFRGDDTSSTIQFIRETWEEIVPMLPLKYYFIDQNMSGWYRNVERMGALSNIFTFIAIFIASLGLFGLASFTSEQRSKEIGIRKVLGSSVTGIVFLLSREFAKCLLIANLIAWPLAYLILKNWLRGFAYQTQFGFELFIIAAMVTFLIAVLAISLQALRAARANPVVSLRYE